MEQRATGRRSHLREVGRGDWVRVGIGRAPGRWQIGGSGDSSTGLALVGRALQWAKAWSLGIPVAVEALTLVV